jgi:hypothetical protein
MPSPRLALRLPRFNAACRIIKMPELSVALFNYENGGRSSSGEYDFTKLIAAFAGLDEAPDLIMLNEAKGYHTDGKTVLYRAAGDLADELRRPYVGEVGFGNRGYVSYPALIYDPRVVRLDFWGDYHESVHPDRKNYAKMHVYGKVPLNFVCRLSIWIQKAVMGGLLKHTRPISLLKDRPRYSAAT